MQKKKCRKYWKIGWKRTAKKIHAKKIDHDLAVSEIQRVKINVRCSESRSEDCEKNRIKTWQWIRSDNLDLLIFTNGSANKNAKSSQLQQEIYCSFQIEMTAKKLND